MSRGYPLPPCIVAMSRPCPLSPDGRRAASSGDGSGRRGNSGRLESNQQSRRYLARLPLTSLPVVVTLRLSLCMWSECAPMMTGFPQSPTEPCGLLLFAYINIYPFAFCLGSNGYPLLFCHTAY